MAEEYGLGVAIWDEGGEDDSSNSTEITLGIAEYTKGGMAFRYSETFWGPTYDQGGSTPVDQVKTGESAEVDVFIAEGVLDKFAKLFPAATIVSDGDSSNPKMKIEWGGKIGEGFLKYAKPLTIRPIANIGAGEPDGESGEATDIKDQDVTLLHAIPMADFELAYQLEQEKVYKITFTGVRDKETGKLWVMGDQSITAPGGNGD